MYKTDQKLKYLLLSENIMTEHPEAFVFCWYPDGWTPRAVIADISKLDDFTNDQMSKMLSVGNIVERVTRNSIVDTMTKEI